MDIGVLNTPVAMLIAAVKATLVLVFFMHLKWSSKLTILVAVVGFLWLVILAAFTVADYMSRAAVEGWLG